MDELLLTVSKNCTNEKLSCASNEGSSLHSRTLPLLPPKLKPGLKNITKAILGVPDSNYSMMPHKTLL